MSLKFSACSAFAATLFGLALTTMPRSRVRRGGHAELSKPRGVRLYRLFNARFRLRLHAARAARRSSTIKATVQRFGPRSVSPTMRSPGLGRFRGHLAG